MIGLSSRLSKGSRDALHAANGTRSGATFKPIVPEGAGSHHKPPAFLLLDASLDAEVEALLKTASAPVRSFASTPLRSQIRRMRMGSPDVEQPRTPSPKPLSAKNLIALEERRTQSKAKHVRRIQEAELERHGHEGNDPARTPKRLSQSRNSKSRGRSRRSTPSPSSSPIHSPRSPLTLEERSTMSHAYELSTSTRAIYILERKAFGRDPITNDAAPLRCAGSPTANEPASAHTHLEKVRSTLPALASAVQPDYYDPPRPNTSMEKIAPKLFEFFEELHHESADIWQRRAERNLRTPSREAGFYSPVSSFHGIRNRAPHVRGLSL